MIVATNPAARMPSATLGKAGEGDEQPRPGDQGRADRPGRAGRAGPARRLHHRELQRTSGWQQGRIERQAPVHGAEEAEDAGGIADQGEQREARPLALQRDRARAAREERDEAAEAEEHGKQGQAVRHGFGSGVSYRRPLQAAIGRLCRYVGWMRLGVELVILLLLLLVNGVFSMGEIALVSARRARLAVLERQGVPGAAKARELADDPQRFLPTVQVGITTVSVVAGVFGGAQFSAPLARALALVPALGRDSRHAGLRARRRADDVSHAGAGRAGAQAARAAPAGAGRRPRRAPARHARARGRTGGVVAERVVGGRAARVRREARRRVSRSRRRS